ncbi:hypothetical protein COS64_02440 [archaeon CG06_land_8_20_14_3_00_37_11]|nr:MAG: hypothetical protein COS64_02440 [archaeon CG06_land_8_20_14_3_00_37_11]
MVKVKNYLIIGLLLVSAYLVLPFFSVIFSSLLITYLILPSYNWLNNLIRNRSISSLLATIFYVSLFTSLFYLFTRMILFSFAQLQSLFDTNIMIINNILSGLSTKLFIETNPSNIVSFTETIFLNAPKTGLDIILLTFMVFFLLRDSPKLKRIIYKFLSKKNSLKLNYFIDRAHYILNNVLLEYFFAGLMMGLIIFVSLSLLNINHALELSTVALITNIFPVISGWLVTILLSIYYYINNNFFNSGMLFIISIILIFINYYFNRIFSDEKGINPLILVLGLFSGVLSMGIFGFVAGPILAGLIQAGYETIYN